MSGSNCCFLNCIQTSQEAGKVVWYFHLFKNFPQFVVIHTVKCFGVVNEVEIDVFFWKSLAFSIFGSSAFFSNSAWISRHSWFMYCWSLTWRILSITLLACEIIAILRYFEHSLALPFFSAGMKTNIFQSCGHCWIFQIYWHIERNTFTASTGILSPPLALFLVMLPKAHLT